MAEHPDDARFLDAQPWTMVGVRRTCDSCETRAVTIVVGLIERGSGPTYEVRYCRSCVGRLLQRARRLAERRGEAFAPALPERTQL